jgi:flagellar M-ring protein FliF
MRERLVGAYNQVIDKWNSLEKAQKIRLAAIAAVFLLSLGITVYLTLRTRMAVLVDNRDITAISGMQTALNEAGIKNKRISSGRGLAVDEKKVVDSQVIIAENGLLDEGGTKGFTYLDALNYSGMGTTETIKKENMKKVKETELAAALRLFDGISKATVNLTMPDENYYFIKPQEPARASAVLTVASALGKAQSLTVARFLCASVVGLEMQNIEISDQNYNVVYSGLQESTGGAGSQYDQEQLRKNEIEMKIKVSLAPLFDSVTVINDNLKFNWDKLVETSQIISSPINGSDTGVVLKENNDKLTEQGTTSGEAPGVGANDLQTNTYQTQGGGASSSSRKTTATEYGYNQTQRTVESASGALSAAQSTIAVMVYRNKIYSQKAVEPTLSGQSWEDFKAGTSEVPLDIDFAPIRDIIAKGTGLAAESISVYGYEVPIFADAMQSSANPAQIMMFAVLGLLLLMLLFGLISKMPPAEVVEINPELSVEVLLETTKREEEKEGQKLKEIDYSKVSESKKMIDKFVSEKPEAVAQLLRNWLNDNWE